MKKPLPRCLFCEREPKHVSAYIDNNQHSALYFVCKDHWIGRSNIKEAVSSYIERQVESMYATCVGIDKT